MSDAAHTATTKPMIERNWSEAAWGYVIWIALIALLVWSWGPAEMGRWTYLFTDSGNMAEYASGFLQPNFKDWSFYLEEMVVTIQIALWGTFLAVLLSIPFGILCAHNMAPWWINQPVRRLMDFFRAIHEVVFAVLFVVPLG